MRFGTGSGASRLVAGSLDLHHQLEAALAELKKTEAALLFPTGFMANLAVLTTFAGEPDLIVSDKLNHASLLDAATPGQDDKPARSTSIAYRDVLTQLWLLDPVPAWAPSGNPLARLGQAPQHHLADPALAARLLGLSAEALLDGDGRPIGPQAGTMLGHLFQSLSALCIRVPAQAAEASVGHLRTRNGDHEIDLVVVRDDGKVLAIEVKLSTTVDDRDTTHLHWLAGHLGDALLDAIIVNTGPNAYRRPDGIGVVPLGLIAP